MAELNADILLMSSDARHRYAEDVLSVIAAPIGSELRFRYERTYLSPGLQQLCGGKNVLGKSAIIAFNASAGEAFFLPVRLVSIIDVTIIADVFVFRFRVGSFVDLDEYPRKVAAINASSRTYFSQISEMNNEQKFAAYDKFPLPTNAKAARSSETAWMSVVHRLSLHSTFDRSHFLRVEAPTSGRKNNVISFGSDGALSLTEEKPVRIVAHYYSASYSVEGRKLECLADNIYLRNSSASSYEVASRYDSAEFWLQPALVNFSTFSTVTVELRGSAGELTPRVAFPVVVQRSRIWVGARMFFGGLGAFMLAVPAILGPTSDTALKVSLGLAGAFIVSYVTVYLSSGRK